MKTIWALFSVENNHDQPDNNLIAWWEEKPSFDVLAKALDLEGFPCPTDQFTLYVVNLWQGASEQITSGGTLYRLELISEGML